MAQVRVFGGVITGAAESVDALRHRKAFRSASAVRNGLRPRWGEKLVALTSHPETAVLHLEV